MKINKYKWIRYFNNNDRITYSRLQIPLVLAYAITVHKCQGLTLEGGVVDLGKTVFADSAAYVALSRFKTSKNLYISNYSNDFIKVSNEALNYVNTLENIKLH